MRRFLSEEAGFTLVELVVVTFVGLLLTIVLADMFASGLRTSATANAHLSNQSNSIVALDRLEFEARCASQATLVSGGTGVTLALPTTCPHATGTWTWCVTSGSLEEYSGSACSGSGDIFASNVTSATPFSCIATVGDYPELQIALTVNSNSNANDALTTTEQIALHNAALTTSTSAACS